jgi:hypothetical protein
VPPPWREYPGYPPGDPFWRQSGQAWLEEIWQPYWQSLTLEAQREYLERWKVPDVWRMIYFDPAFGRWLDEVDED